VVALLLERDPGSVYATNEEGQTALACAQRRKRAEQHGVLEVLERVRAATAPPVQSLPAPTQATMEMLFPPAVMRVASMSSITSALHQKRMLCCDCPKIDAITLGNYQHGAVAVRGNKNTLQAHTTTHTSKSTLKTGNVFGTNIEAAPLTAVPRAPPPAILLPSPVKAHSLSPQHPVRQPNMQPATPTSSEPPPHARAGPHGGDARSAPPHPPTSDRRDARHAAPEHSPPQRQPPPPPRPPSPAKAAVPMHAGPMPPSLAAAPSPYGLRHERSLPASQQSFRKEPPRNISSSYERQETPLRKMSSLQRRESNRGWARP